MESETLHHCDRCEQDFYYDPSVHRCPGEWEAMTAHLPPLADPYAGPPADAELAASRDRVDAAVLAHRAEPTEANEAAVLAAMADHHDLFLRYQIIDYQARTRSSRFADWTRENVVIHDEGRTPS